MLLTLEAHLHTHLALGIYKLGIHKRLFKLLNGLILERATNQSLK